MISAVGKIYRRMRNPLVRRALILAYHRVCPPAGADPFRLMVSPRNFEEQLELLSRGYTVLSLGELVARLARRRLPRRCVVVTFDDGYLDNLTYARPLLERFGVPATVFVTSGYIGKPAFWWDRLLHLVFNARSLPAEIRLAAGNTSWTLRPAEEAADRSDYPDGSPEPEEFATRRRCYLALWRFLRSHPLETKEDLLDQLICTFPGAINEGPEARPCSETELSQLVSGGLISLGAHSVSHPVLSALTESEQAREMAESRQRLEQVIGVPVLDFSYPHGTMSDLDSSSIKKARESGFRCACTAMRGVVESDSGLYELPRIAVTDIGGDAFERLLKKHFAWTKHENPPSQHI